MNLPIKQRHASTETMIRTSEGKGNSDGLGTHLLLDTESLAGGRARPLTPAVREGSELELLVCTPSLGPHVLGFRLARNEDLGDWVVVGLLATGGQEQDKRHVNNMSVNTSFTSL